MSAALPAETHGPDVECDECHDCLTCYGIGYRNDRSSEIVISGGVVRAHCLACGGDGVQCPNYRGPGR